MENALDIYCSIQDEAEWDIVSQALSYRKGMRFAYTKLYPLQLKLVWGSYARMGMVLYNKPVERIMDTMLYNTAILSIMTGCMGHKRYCGIEEAVDRYELTRYQARKLKRVILDLDGWAEFSNRQPLLSDYATDKLEALAIKTIEEPDYGRRICYMDQMLNISHCRSDLTELYVEGGSKSLTELSNLNI